MSIPDVNIAFAALPIGICLVAWLMIGIETLQARRVPGR